MLQAVHHELAGQQAERDRAVEVHLQLGATEVEPNRLPLGHLELQQAAAELLQVGAEVDLVVVVDEVELVVHDPQRLDPAGDHVEVVVRLRCSLAALQADETGDDLEAVLDPVLQLVQQDLLLLRPPRRAGDAS